MFAFAAKLNPVFGCELPPGLLAGEVALKDGAGGWDGAPNGVAVLVELPPPNENIPDPVLPVALGCGLLVLELDD